MTNPYDAPKSNLTTDSLDVKTPSVQQNTWSQGWHWFIEATSLIKHSPALITGACLIMVGISIITSIVTASIPVIGHYVGYAVGLIANAGFILICTRLLDGVGTGIADLFIPFQTRLSESALSSLLSGLAIFAITITCLMTLGLAIYLGISGSIESTEFQRVSSLREAIEVISFGALSIMVIAITAGFVVVQTVYMAAIYACFLTYAHNMQPTSGLVLALRACLANIGAVISLWCWITLAAIPWIAVLFFSVSFSEQLSPTSEGVQTLWVPTVNNHALFAAAFPLGLVNWLIYSCSLATSYRGIFFGKEPQDPALTRAVKV